MGKLSIVEGSIKCSLTIGYNFTRDASGCQTITDFSILVEHEERKYLLYKGTVWSKVWLLLLFVCVRVCWEVAYKLVGIVVYCV